MLKRILSPLLVMSLVSTASLPSFAVPPNQTHSPEVDLLAYHLGELELTGELGSVGETEDEAKAHAKKYRNSREFLIGMVNDFSKRGWCPEERSDVAEYDRLECLRSQFTGLYSKALNEGVLDSVEAAILTYYVESFAITENREFTIDSEQLSSLGNSRKAPKRDQVLVPQFTDYRFKKLGLLESRKAKGVSADGELDPAVVALISKHYKKSIRGLGRVGAIEAITIKYNRNALGELSKLMTNMIWFWTSDMKITGSKDGETRELKLTNDDYATIALNSTLSEIRRRPTDPNDYLYGHRVVLDDVVIASVLTGDMDINWARAILAYPEFKQPKPDKSKFLQYLGDIARTLLITQPQLLPFYSLGSIIFDSVKRNKADRTEYNNETRTIPVSSVR